MALTGCSGQDQADVFAGHDDVSALLIQWKDDGRGNLIGSVQVADKAATSSGPPVEQTTLSFNGSVKSERVSLDVAQGLGQIQTWTGTLDGDQLQVNVPQGDGFRSLLLERASAARFNADVAALEATVVKARNEAARAGGVARQQANGRNAAVEAQEAFAAAVNDVSTSQEALLALLDAPPELQALAPDLRSGRENLAKVKSAVDEAAFRSRGFVACEYARQSRRAADDVADDASFLEDDVRAVNDAAGDLVDARAEFSRAYSTLLRLSARGGQSSKASSASLERLIKKARTTAQEWRKAAMKAEKSMQGIVGQAESLSENAIEASC